jgi:hypothetical protein
MPKVGWSLALAASLLLAGCIVTAPLTTKTEVIASGDSVPVFGTQAAIRFGQQLLAFRWDPATHGYVSQPPEGGMVRAVRAARLKGDVYLLQVAAEDETEGYFLIPFRVSGLREVMPLACDVPRAAAEEFGVQAGPRDSLWLELTGDRAGIIGVLAGAVGTCKSQFQIDTFVPSGRELAQQAAVVQGGATGGCRPCPSGACIQGTLRDQTGASLPGATIRAAVEGGTADSPTARSDAQGNFLLAGLPDGRVEVRIELAGFCALKLAPIQAKRGTTSLFDEPFELEVARPPFETTAAPQRPRVCSSRDRTPH